MERNLSDEQIVSRIQEGDNAMFRLIVSRYNQPLLNYIARFTGRGDDAEDVLQELFIRVFRSLSGFDPSRRFKPWLYRIATNLCYDFLKRKKPSLSLDKDYASADSDRGTTLLDFIPDENYDPEKHYLRRELLDEIKERIDTLPEGQRETFLLFHFEEMQYKDIAETLKIPVGTVKSRLHNACRRIFLSLSQREGRVQA